MKIAIIGSGGREHAICQKIYESRKKKEIFCIPGNGGTSKIAKNINLNLKNFNSIKEFLISEKIDLTIVGPEEPLVNGIVDYLNKDGIMSSYEARRSNAIKNAIAKKKVKSRFGT